MKHKPGDSRQHDTFEPSSIKGFVLLVRSGIAWAMVVLGGPFSSQIFEVRRHGETVINTRELL